MFKIFLILFEEKLLTMVNAANNPLYYNQTNGNLKFNTTGKIYNNFHESHAKNYLKNGAKEKQVYQ